MRQKFSLAEVTRFLLLLLVLSDFLFMAVAVGFHNYSISPFAVSANIILLIVSGNLTIFKRVKVSKKAAGEAWSFVQKDVIDKTLGLKSFHKAAKICCNAILSAVGFVSLLGCVHNFGSLICHGLYSVGAREQAERIYKPISVLSSDLPGMSFSEKFFYQNNIGAASGLRDTKGLIKLVYGKRSSQLASWHEAIADMEEREFRSRELEKARAGIPKHEIDAEFLSMYLSIERHYRKALKVYEASKNGFEELSLLRKIARAQYLRESEIELAVTLNTATIVASEIPDSKSLARPLELLAVIFNAQGNFEQSKKFNARAKSIRERALMDERKTNTEASIVLITFLLIICAGRFSRSKLLRTASRQWLRDFYTSPNCADSLKALHKLVLYEQSRGNLEQAEEYSIKAFNLVSSD